MDRAEGALLVAETALEVARQYAQALDELKSSMAVQIRKAVDDAFAAMPKPKDGERGPEGAAGAPGAVGPMGPAGKDAPVIDKFEVVREVMSLLPAPKEGPSGRDGKDADIDAIAAEVFTQVMKSIPVVKDGRDGKDADHAAIAAEVLSQVRKEMPVPQNGRDGRDGESVSVEAVASMVQVEVLRSVAAIPAGKDGAPGRDADPVDAEAIVCEVLKRIPTPKDGVDGKSVDLEAVEAKLDAAAARWELGMERRASEILQSAIDKMPMPKDGRDGIDWSEFDAELDDDGRTLIIKMGRGDQKVEKRIKTSIPAFVGSWKAGEKYEKGDCVNWGGSMWVALKDSPDRPSSEGSGWQLAVRRGADPKVS